MLTCDYLPVLENKLPKVLSLLCPLGPEQCLAPSKH